MKAIKHESVYLEKGIKMNPWIKSSHSLAGPSGRAYLGSCFEMFMGDSSVLKILRPDWIQFSILIGYNINVAFAAENRAFLILI